MLELTIDHENYKASGIYHLRKTVRGVICRDGQYLTVLSKYGDYTFPGGGIEAGETQLSALIREVREETGCHVLPDSARLICVTHERRRGNRADLLVMDSYYYACDVGKEADAPQLTASEIADEMRPVWVSPETALTAARALVHQGNAAWMRRELAVMEALWSAKCPANKQ